MTESYTKLPVGKESKIVPNKASLDFILGYSKSVEVKKKGAKKVLIHLN